MANFDVLHKDYLAHMENMLRTLIDELLSELVCGSAMVYLHESGPLSLDSGHSSMALLCAPVR